jgi:hypothetical protein
MNTKTTNEEEDAVNALLSFKKDYPQKILKVSTIDLTDELPHTAKIPRTKITPLSSSMKKTSLRKQIPLQIQPWMLGRAPSIRPAQPITLMSPSSEYIMLSKAQYLQLMRLK